VDIGGHVIVRALRRGPYRSETCRKRKLDIRLPGKGNSNSAPFRSAEKHNDYSDFMASKFYIKNFYKKMNLKL